jgi:hypothetical protein
MRDGVRTKTSRRNQCRIIASVMLFFCAIASAVPAAEFPDYKFSLLPEDESVYAPPAAPRENAGTNQGGVNLDLKMTYLSDYLYRGVNHSFFPGRSGKPNAQFEGAVTWDTGRLPHPFIGVFVNLYNDDPVSRFQEIRPSAGLDWKIRPLDFTFGVTSYIYPEREKLFNTSEVWTRITFDDSILWKTERPIFAPYGFAAYDYDKNHGFYFEAGIQHDFIIEDTGITLTAFADVGYINGIRQQFIFFNKERFGFQHWDVGLIGRYSLNRLFHFSDRYGEVTLNGYLNYTAGINRDVIVSATKVWGGVGLQFRY